MRFASHLMQQLPRTLAFLCVLVLFGIVLVSAQGPLAPPKPQQSPSPVETSDPSTTEEATPHLDPARNVSAAGEGALSALEDTVAGVARGLSQNESQAEQLSNWMSQFLHIDVFGFSLGQLLLSFLILLLTLTLRRVITNLLFHRLKKFFRKTKSEHDDQLLGALEKPASYLLLIIGLFIAIAVLPMEDAVRGLVTYIFRAAILVVIVWGAVRLTDVIGGILTHRFEKRKDSALSGFVPLINKTLKVFVLIIGVLMAVDNLGYNVTGIIATLGLGTAAVALASQDTLKNGFGALMIMLDRPFKVGDWIQVGDQVDGDVESIGLRSTKVRTFPKTVLSIPNGVLANEYVNNWSRMPKRRVKQVVGVTYDASAQKIDALVEEIRELLRNDDGVDPSFILVNFTDFGASSLDILVYYFTKSTSWLVHMDVRQRINCKIMETIKGQGLSIAFPTRTVHLAAQSGEAPSGLPGDFGPDSPP